MISMFPSLMFSKALIFVMRSMKSSVQSITTLFALKERSCKNASNYYRCLTGKRAEINSESVSGNCIVKLIDLGSVGHFRFSSDLDFPTVRIDNLLSIIINHVPIRALYR